MLDAKLVAAGRARAGQAVASPKAGSRCTWAGATPRRAADDLIRKCVAWTWQVKLSLSAWSATCSRRLREEAEKVAIKVFAENLRDLLLAAPAGPRVVMGLDPGIRTGVQGGGGRRDRQAARHRHRLSARAAPRLGRLAARARRSCARQHGVNLIAIGNGTASRETDKLAADLIKRAAARELRAVARSSSAKRAPRSTRPASSRRRNCPIVDVSLRGAASASRAACRTRWPSW